MMQTTWGIGSTVESVVKTSNNGLLIAAAAALHIPNGATVVDMTYGKGGFWTHYQPKHLTKHDLYTVDGVDFRDLPETDNSISVAVFDPPYMPTSNHTSTRPDFHERYGLDTEKRRTDKDIRDLYTDGIAEAHRILKREGILMVKTQDYVNNGKYQTMRHHVVTTALANGLSQVDEFVHHSGTGPGAWDVQKTSRRAHSFLCVFRKSR